MSDVLLVVLGALLPLLGIGVWRLNSSGVVEVDRIVEVPVEVERIIEVEKIVEVTPATSPGASHTVDDGHEHMFNENRPDGWHCGWCWFLKPPDEGAVA